MRVVVYARAGHAAAARTAVRQAHGIVLITSGKVIEVLLPPKAVQRLVASKHVARLQPVEVTPALSTMTGLKTGLTTSGIADTSGVVSAALTSEADATVPEPPTVLFVEAGDGQVIVSFDPPASDGGDAIAYCTATSYPGGQSGNSTGEPITVGGLTNGVEYTFTVTATNGVGVGGNSLPSEPVTPEGSSRLNPEPPGASPRPPIPEHSRRAGAEQPTSRHPRVLGRSAFPRPAQVDGPHG